MPDTPLKQGLTHAGDAVTLFTPAAARDALQVIDRAKFGDAGVGAVYHGARTGANRLLFPGNFRNTLDSVPGRERTY